MIYTVECSFADPARESEWNDFYSNDKLPALISVSGFLTSQRLKALIVGQPTYLAIHTITDPNVLSSVEYRKKGGGNFAKWQSAIMDWHRNIYDGMDLVPAISDGQCLLGSTRSGAELTSLGLRPFNLEAIAMDHLPAKRWFAVIDEPGTRALALVPHGVSVYIVLGKQLKSLQ